MRRSHPFLAACAFALPHAPAAFAAGSPRFLAPPVVEIGSGGAVTWAADIDCADTVAASLLGARAVFGLDEDLDGAPEAADSSGLSPADCEGGRLGLRRTFFPARPALLRADLRNAAGTLSATHLARTAAPGSLLRLSRYCARPKDGEPEWAEIRNVTERAIPLAAVRFEGRALSGRLSPGEAVAFGSDTAELALWQPGVPRQALSSWPNLRNSGDTIRLGFDGGGDFLVIDSVVYGSGAYPGEDCASLADEGAAAAASGYALEFPATRWRPRAGAFVAGVRAPADGRYDLRVFDLDGRELCALARDAVGPASHVLPGTACAGLAARRGIILLHLAPRGAPGVRRALPIIE